MAKTPKLTRKPRIASPNAFTPEKKAAFFEKLAETCHVGEAAEAAGISKVTIYQHRKTDPEFAAAYDEARTRGFESLEDVVTLRAKEKSDLLAIFLLKGAMPDKYRERRDVSVSGELKISRYSVADLEKATGDK